MVNFWQVPNGLGILLVKKHASRSKKPACKVKMSSLNALFDHLLEMFHLKNRSIIASDSSKWQNITPIIAPVNFNPFESKPRPWPLPSSQASLQRRFFYNDAYKVSPLVWSIFFGQNADLTSWRYCIGNGVQRVWNSQNNFFSDVCYIEQIDIYEC